MQSDDTKASPQPSGEPIPVSQPTGQWTIDQHTGNGTPTSSAGGYGRPDPEEFGPEPIDREPPQVDLIPEVIPLERVPFEPENRITEPSTNIGITAAEIIGADLSSETSSGLQRFQPHQEPPLETGNPNSGPWDHADRGTVTTPASPHSETFIAVDSDIRPGSVNGQPLQDAPEWGIALWPETSHRDQAEKTQLAATPDQGQHDDRHQVIEPPTDQSFGAETGHLPQAPDLDLNLNSGPVSPNRPGEPGPQTGPIDPPNRHHSFGAQESVHIGTTAAHRVDDGIQSGDLGSDRSALNGDLGRLGSRTPFELDEEGEDLDPDLDENPPDETRDLLIPVPIGAPNAKSGAPRSRARSLKTEHQYDGRVRLIWRRSVDKRSPDPQQPVVVTPLEVTQDFLLGRSALSPASWNLYRAALLWHLAQHRHDNELYEQAYQLFSSTNADAKQRKAEKTRKGSSKRSIPEDHLNQLLDTLCAMNRHVNWGSRTSFWLQAGLAAGARPGEWNGANWLDESQTVLCIPNGKRKTTVPIFSIVGPGKTIHDVEADSPELLTPGSAYDETKRIRNVPIEQRDRIWVNLHMGALNSYLDRYPEEEREHRFDIYYNMCRKVLRNACIRTFNGKKQYPLYVMRSQYGANLKAEMPLSDVSERMGHESSGKTTKKDYAPRSAAHGGRGAPTPLEKQAKTDAQKARAANALSAGVPVTRPRE